jgi:hypothetical protein
MLRDGQQSAAALHYAPLPKEVVAKEQQAISRVTAADGAPLLGK